MVRKQDPALTHSLQIARARSCHGWTSLCLVLILGSGPAAARGSEHQQHKQHTSHHPPYGSRPLGRSGSLALRLTGRAGTPKTVEPGGKSRITTELAPMTQSSPTV